MKILRGLKRGFKNVVSYLKNVRLEMRKVSWPTKRETFRSTLIVIFVSLIVAMFLGALDFIFISVLNKLIL